MEAEYQDYENNQKWSDIFNNMRARAAKLPSIHSNRNRHLNRYLDVLAFDNTRVKIDRKDVNYINANYVRAPSAGRTYILTQGPLKHTAGHFWSMIWEQNTKGILMLNKVIEGGSLRCHQYWPDGSENGHDDEIIFDDVDLKVSLISSQKQNSYIFRKLQITDLNTNEKRTVYHFHYVLWPDFDSPESYDSFLEYWEAVKMSECLDNSKYGPAVVHCSAGIGRSGTFVLVDSCLLMIAKNQCRDSINILDILFEMRKCRMGLIQTPGQLRFSFQTIIEGSKRILNDTESDKTSQKRQNLMRLFGVPDDSSSNTDDYDEDNKVDSLSTDDNDDNDDNIEKIEQNNTDYKDNEENILKDNQHEPLIDTIVEDDGKKQRDAEREEKRKNMMEQINRVKRKKAEEEERLKFNQKIIKYTAQVVCVTVAVCIGIYAIARKNDSFVSS